MIKKIIFLLSFLLTPLFVFAENTPQDVYFISLSYDKGKIMVEEVKTGQAIFYPPKTQPADGYILKIISDNKEVIYSVRFTFPLEIVFEPQKEWFNEKGEQIYFPKAEEVSQKLDQASIVLTAPFDQRSKEFLVLDPQGKEVLNYGLADFKPKSSCGDGFCQVFEDEKSCSQDCKIIASQNVPNKKSFFDKIPVPFLWGGIGFIILILGGVLYWLWSGWRYSKFK